MKKKLLVGVMFMALTLSACTKTDDTGFSNETEAATIASEAETKSLSGTVQDLDIEDTTDSAEVDETDPEDQEISSDEYTTVGIYEYSEFETDASGEYEKANPIDRSSNLNKIEIAYFSTSDNEVAAIISDDTEVDDLYEGHEYEISHSGIITHSKPGIYTNVYRIKDVSKDVY